MSSRSSPFSQRRYSTASRIRATLREKADISTACATFLPCFKCPPSALATTSVRPVCQTEPHRCENNRVSGGYKRKKPYRCINSKLTLTDSAFHRRACGSRSDVQALAEI